MSQVQAASHTKACLIKADLVELVAEQDRTKSILDSGAVIRLFEGRFLEGGWHTWYLSWRRHRHREQGSSKQHIGLGRGKPGVVTTQGGPRNRLQPHERRIVEVSFLISLIIWRVKLRRPLVESHGGPCHVGSTAVVSTNVLHRCAALRLFITCGIGPYASYCILTPASVWHFQSSIMAANKNDDSTARTNNNGSDTVAPRRRQSTILPKPTDLSIADFGGLTKFPASDFGQQRPGSQEGSLPPLYIPGHTEIFFDGQPVKSYEIVGFTYRMIAPDNENRSSMIRQTISRVTLRYELHIIQGPKRARACGSGPRCKPPCRNSNHR